MKTVKFIIIRHGYSKGNKEKRFSGQMDVELDEVGYSQAAATAEYVSKNFHIDAIYSSDLSRAYETVKPIAEALGMEIHKCKDLREADVGNWQGKLVEEVKKEYPESFAFYKESPGFAKIGGAESYADVINRARKAIEKIAEENEGKTILIGTHGGVIRSLRVAWEDNPPEKIKEIPHVPNSSVSVAEYKNGVLEWLSIGYDNHLSDKTTEEAVK
ncbi:MAG: histidine phosphatase family protein [Clostridia bacterium]|nr:histidine phosphatase family protein [Clostridia bacterium]